jgi:hypothetical protein
MTILIERPPTPSTFPLHRRARWAAAALFILGGALQLAEFVLERSPDASGARVAWWLAHDLRTQLSQALGLLALPLMIGGFLYGYRLIREQSRRLSLVAISLLVTAMVGLGLVHGIEFAARWAAVAGHRAAAVDILEVGDPGLPGIVGFVMFLGCAVLGNVLVAVALWRSHYVHRIVAVLVIAFAVLDFAAGQGLAAHVLDLGTDGLFAWACLSGYVRTAPATTSSETGPMAGAAGAH